MTKRRERFIARERQERFDMFPGHNRSVEHCPTCGRSDRRGWFRLRHGRPMRGRFRAPKRKTAVIHSPGTWPARTNRGSMRGQSSTAAVCRDRWHDTHVPFIPKYMRDPDAPLPVPVTATYVHDEDGSAQKRRVKRARQNKDRR